MKLLHLHNCDGKKRSGRALMPRTRSSPRVYGQEYKTMRKHMEANLMRMMLQEVPADQLINQRNKR